MTIAKIRLSAAYLAGIEFWPMTILVMASVLLSSLLPLVIGLAVLFWLIRWVGCGRLTLRTPADGAVAFLSMMALIALQVTAVPEKTLIQVLRLFSGIALGYTIVNWAVSLPRLKLLGYGLALVGLAIALFAPFSVTWNVAKLSFIPESLYSRFAVLVADAVHPNTMGGNLVTLLPIPLGIIVFGWRDISLRNRVWLGLVVFLMVLVIFLTKSRGAWIALLMVVVLESLLKWRYGWMLLVALALAVVLFLTFSGFPSLIEVLTTNDALGGFEGRREIWSRALMMIRDFPFTGIGMGSYVEVVDVLYPYFFFLPGQIVHAHNLFLQIAVDLGLPGLIAWLAIFFLATAADWQIFRRAQDRGQLWLVGLGAGLLGSQVTLSIHGLTDASTWGSIRTAPLIWTLWGLTFASLYSLARDG